MVACFVLMKIVLDQTARLHVKKVIISEVPSNASAKLKTESRRPFGLEMIHTVKVSWGLISFEVAPPIMGTFLRLYRYIKLKVEKTILVVTP